MPTNDERREVAENLRNMCICGCRYKEEFYDLLVETVMRAWDFHKFSDVADRLAELIEPEERTCHMVFDHLTDTAFCDVCGERFDGVAQYMAMVPNGFSVADYKAKYKDARFCPHCGARVIQE